MQYKTLGKQGLIVSALGLGCMGMSEFYGQTDDKQSIYAIHRALELGINFFDTADMYGTGHNEELLGRAVRDRRDKVILATKFGVVRKEDGGLTKIVKGTPEYVHKACNASLKRLGVETIDLYYQHRVDPDTPIEETVGAMADLVKAGKVRYLGLSETPAELIERAHAVHPISALQTEYSLWTRDVEVNILTLCHKLGIGYVAYSPLGRGFLTGRIRTLNDFEEDDYRPYYFPRFKKENLSYNLKIVQGLEAVAHSKNCTMAQLCLAWLLHRSDSIVPIVGTKRSGYLEENIQALTVTLTSDDLKTIDHIAPLGAARGERYPD